MKKVWSFVITSFPLVAQTTGFITARQGNLFSFDPSSPNPPTQFTTTPLSNISPMTVGNYARALSIDGTTCYVLGRNGYVYTFDVNMPSNPVALTTTTANIVGGGSGVFDIAVANGRGFIASGNNAAGMTAGVIWEFDPTTPGPVQEYANIPPPPSASVRAVGIAIHNGVGYVGDTAGRIWTFNPSGTAPQTVSQLTNPQGAVANPDPFNCYGINFYQGTGLTAAQSYNLPTNTQNSAVFSFNPSGAFPQPYTQQTDMLSPIAGSSNNYIFEIGLNGTTAYLPAIDGNIYNYDVMLPALQPLVLSPYQLPAGAGFPTSVVFYDSQPLPPPPPPPAPPPPPVIGIDLTRLTGNNLALAKYLNAHASKEILDLFIHSDDLSTILENANPTRNSASTFMAQRIQVSFQQTLDNHLNRITSPKPRHSKLVSQMGDAIPSFSQESTSTSIWANLVGEYTHQKAQHQTPSFQAASGGIVAACDFYDMDHTNYFGLGGAYGYTYVDQDHHAGRAEVDQGSLVLYGGWVERQWVLQMALWGGIYSNYNVRVISIPPFSGSAKSKVNGWLIAPHIEFAYDCFSRSEKFQCELFLMGDWVTGREGNLKEHGADGLNMGQASRHSSLARSETGIRFSETIKARNCTFVFLGKASYVYQKLFDTGVLDAFLIGSPGFFTVSTLVGAQNLGVGEFGVFFSPKNPKTPYGNFFYQGEFGSHYQAHQVSTTIGWDF